VSRQHEKEWVKVRQRQRKRKRERKYFGRLYNWSYHAPPHPSFTAAYGYPDLLDADDQLWPMAQMRCERKRGRARRRKRRRGDSVRHLFPIPPSHTITAGGHRRSGNTPGCDPAGAAWLGVRIAIHVLLLGLVLAMTCGVRPTRTRRGRTQGAVGVMWSLVRDADIHKLGQLARPHTRATDSR
jgi:hypothetical protein